MLAPGHLPELLDSASGSFSFVSAGVRMTYDFRKIYNNLILARDWRLTAYYLSGTIEE